MNNTNGITISAAQGNINEYIIRDAMGITIGRFFIIQLQRENRYCCFKVKYYRNNKDGLKELKQAVSSMLNTLFRKNNMFKINVICEEDLDINTFVELGFELEGVILESIYKGNGVYKHQFMFGINYDRYRVDTGKKLLNLKGRRVDVKVLTPENAEEVLDYYIRNREHLKPYEAQKDDEFYTLEVQKQGLIEAYKHFLNGDSISFGIYDRDRFIGKIKLSNIVMGVFRNGFIGYSLDEKEQGKGYMKEALNLVLNYAFKEIKLHRVEATTLIDNVRSQKVLESCDFKYIGISEKYLYINGKWRDHKVFYKINPHY